MKKSMDVVLAEEKISENELDPETAFLCGLLELQYGQGDVRELRNIAKKVSWAQGWPEERGAFWNAEAFLWQHKIAKEKRELIAQELSFLGKLGKGKNLDLGCGTYSYLPSVGFDLSEKMLQLNEQCLKKVQGDVEKPLPFLAGEFSSVTAVFLFNYVQQLQQLLHEIRRVLQEDGLFIAVLAKEGVQDWQKQKEVRCWSREQWQAEIAQNGFSVTLQEKGGLWFVKAKAKAKKEQNRRKVIKAVSGKQ